MIANNSPNPRGAASIETRTFFYLNTDDKVAFSETLALIATNPIQAPIPGALIYRTVGVLAVSVPVHCLPTRSAEWTSASRS